MQQPANPRPRVDPNALGEVDPTEYPEPKESTHKIRGRSDILELLFGDENQELIVVKLFYFFFYSAFGSLFPLMGVYFKQLGMDPSQCGMLIGCRPFVEFLSAPFWGSYADRWKKGKTLLLASLSCWILFTLPIGYLQPPARNCIKQYGNKVKLELPSTTFLFNDPSKDKVLPTTDPNDTTPSSVSLAQADVGKSPLKVIDTTNPNAENLVSPLYSSVVYKTEDVQKSFFLMLLLIIIGEFFSAPAITLVDSAVITLLGEDADRYGHQRMFGSVGWGLSMFFLGIALDRSTAFTNHPCGLPGEREKNYRTCFFAFSVLMGGALISATQITFRYEDPPETKEPQKQPLSQDEDDALEQEVARQLNLPSLASHPSGGSGQRRQPIPRIEGEDGQTQPSVGKTKMFAQTTREMPEWMTVLKHFGNLKYASFLFVAWLMGFGIGLIFTFLFWHLQEAGGTPTLFGLASIINHISEILAYFWSFKLIRHFGHIKVLCLGLFGNVIRFLYVAMLTKPWLVLPFELMQGITHAAVWAACCSYIAHNTPPELRNSAQGVLQGLHHGLGRGCGAIIGGFFVRSYGSPATFRGYGIFCALVLAAFIFINFYRKDTGFVSDLPMSEDPHQVMEESIHLAPHGVPSNPIPRVLSSSKLQDLTSEGQSYGTTNNTPSNNLHPNSGRGSKNPFLQESDLNHQSNQTYSHETETNILNIAKNYESMSQMNDKMNDEWMEKQPLTSIHIQQPHNIIKAYDW
ncbi:major facilitator superfamily domain-containing protein 6-like [Planococcus citri]|uniref:major facilitator superfamily domain-containing protein 6-like n=1 Tax=Planococcus citri TaxID=170843 RepID=UPI0031F88193